MVFISIFALIGSFFVIKRFQLKNFTVFNSVNLQKVKEIKDTLEEKEELDFTALLCNEIRVPFDEASNTFYVPLDRTSEQWEKLEFMSGQPEFQILFEKDVTDGEKKELIASNEKVSIVVYNDQFWSEYYVTFTGLPIVDLATNEGFYAEEEITGIVNFYDTNFTLHGITSSEYNGHIRGNTSRMFPKKAYKLNLVKTTDDGATELNKISLFGMRKDDDWMLTALYNDDTKIRDQLSMQVWDMYGANTVSEKGYYGPKMTYVEVFADNSYCGLYGLMEPVDAKQLDLAEEDYLYKRKNSGGLNYETFHSSEDPYVVLNGFELKEGIINEEIWQPMARLASVTYTSDEAFSYYIEDTVDMDNILRFWLFMQIITGHDHTAKNVFYVAKYDETLEYKYKFYFAPWDLDLTWGNVSVGEVNPHYTAYEKDTMDNRVRWDTADRLIDMNYDDCQQYVQNLYSMLRKSVLSNEAIEEIIRTQDDVIRSSGAFTRDKERWPEGLHAENCEELISYATGRLEFLDKALYNFSWFDD